MINRRLLRIKVVQVLYAYYQSEDKSIADAEKELLFSIDKTHELYYYFLQLIIEITIYAERKIEQNRSKKLPSHEDLNPNTNFIDNKFVNQLRENETFTRFINTKKLSWVNYPELIKNLFHEIRESEYYNDFMALKEPSYEDDKTLWVKLFKKIITDSEELGNALEEISIYWNDDAELILSMVQKTIKKFDPAKGNRQELLPIFKDLEDLDYVKILLRQAILNAKDYQEDISNTVQNWDVDRLAFMDMLIMQVSIAEAVEFSNIPVKVSINEFIEISKMYSTHKSSVFINGVLDKIIKSYISTGKIKKTGRGLME
ncbi:transcription antitermination protein NusB [Saccharicrinis sp. FJH54]|uniref:transcription antitermination protein NusB n=1 Tax=Saccharicrinis sp. FJH54 TaxID=3344665 RepID=UPI0035D4547E